jgi:hypothetical protein
VIRAAMLCAVLLVSACGGSPIGPSSDGPALPSLPPGAVSETMTASISGGDRSVCLYYSFPESPCAMFARTFGADGRVDAKLKWPINDAVLLLQVWDVAAARVIASAGNLSREGKYAYTVLSSNASAGRYEFRVITAGAPSAITPFTITAQYPR